MFITPTSFGSQILHNGTVYFSARTEYSTAKATLKPVSLPGGGLYDPWGTDPAPTTPGKMNAQVIIIATSEVALGSIVAGITALIGTRESLSGTTLENATISAQARLESITKKHPFQIVEGHKTRLELIFQLYTDWS